MVRPNLGSNRRLDSGGARGAQRSHECLRRRVTVAGLALKRFLDCVVEPAGQFLSKCRSSRRRLGKALDESVLSCERWFTCQHLEQNAPETIGVAPTIELLVAHELLRAHVGRRSWTCCAR